MSGICDTCKRVYCLSRESWRCSCDMYKGPETNWSRLFGTPERAARTAYTMSECCGVACKGCPMDGVCYDEAALLEWLEAEVD